MTRTGLPDDGFRTTDGWVSLTMFRRPSRAEPLPLYECHGGSANRSSASQSQPRSAFHRTTNSTFASVAKTCAAAKERNRLAKPNRCTEQSVASPGRRQYPTAPSARSP